MVFLYNLSIKLLFTLAQISAFLGNKRAKKWVKGQRSIAGALRKIPASDPQPVWFHFASLGEFEQGRPVMEQLRERCPEQQILITFFSPSGYEIRKNYTGANHILYFPLDTAANARRFLDKVRPSHAIFTKYEYWYHFYHELQKRDIPLFVISAIFRKDQVFFKWYGGFFRKILRSVTRFYVQNGESAKLLAQIGLHNVQVSGDTRYDRVADQALNPQSFPEIVRFIGEAHCLVAGSTWPEEEEFLAGSLNACPGWKFIIAPHEVNPQHLQMLLGLFGERAVLYSSWLDSGAFNSDESASGDPGSGELAWDQPEAGSAERETPSVLIIDRIGMLSSLYRYGQVALIGGGFGKGIHNILEAAVFGIPVMFGPNYHKFSEAHELIAAGCAFPVTGRESFYDTFRLLRENATLRERAARASEKIVEKNRGATRRILDTLGKANG